ncbi:MAG: putative transcriptional regulator, MarR family [Magnetococcales bacterium]|nr:putative transcriptional regulator, MarR family [Magnetococcales bacterium]HIJ82803.1 MarR family transcriptional regulator [Magnetococcales bacterium]
MDSELLRVIEQHRDNWPESFDPLLTPFFHTLHRAHGILLGQAFRVMERYGLSPAEFDVLSSLRRSPFPHELTPSQLQQSLLITSGGLTKILQQLQERAFVTRSTTRTDRRVKPVRLTPAAIPVVEQALQSIRLEVGGWITNTVSAEEIERVTQTLGKLTLNPLHGDRE